ncbi:hypothetical protein DHT89_09505 [Salmonella enterica]|nr:hypothetical protein [Salmonella enterica]EDU1961840.1 hypothetical protein [Salmonella enterica subsp. arizonae serovar 53:z4,z23:-]EDV9232433.1 hypothetical protein [Salmonella enterica subsp. arizonae]PVL54313.1 hypothetical protein C4803_13260 [Salmonella enterica subsp. arizonae serovar 51:g,z51:-]EAM5122567.1 hypothetical protein [Salmonella enterica]
MDNTHICEKIRAFTRRTNNSKKWRDNDHINHILFDFFRDLYDGKTQKTNKFCLFFKQINHKSLFSFTAPAHRQRVTSSEHRYRKKIIT